MDSPPERPRNQISYADQAKDEEVQAHRPDHYDHDLSFARAKYAELAPKKEEQVVLPRWMVLSLYFMVILFIVAGATRVFNIALPTP